MKTVTKKVYKCEVCGEVFTTKKECALHEARCPVIGTEDDVVTLTELTLTANPNEPDCEPQFRRRSATVILDGNLYVAAAPAKARKKWTYSYDPLPGWASTKLPASVVHGSVLRFGCGMYCKYHTNEDEEPMARRALIAEALKAIDTEIYNRKQVRDKLCALANKEKEN